MLNWFRKKENFTPILIFVLAAIPFFVNLRDFFVSDDWDFLTQVSLNHQSLWQYFFTNYLGTHAGGSYRPLVVWFWTGLYHFFKLNFFWYHLAQILIHAGTVTVFYLVVRNLFFPKTEKKRYVLALVAAIIFCFLPNHTEAVVWIASIADPLAAFFYLLCLLMLLYSDGRKKYRIVFYALSLVFFIFALLTKEMAMSLPFVVLLMGLYRIFSSGKILPGIKKLAYVLPYFVVLGLYFWLRYRAIGIFFGYYGEAQLHLSAGKAFSDYLNIIVSFFLSGNIRTVASLWLSHHFLIVLIGLVVVLVAGVVICWRYKLAKFPWLVLVALFVSLAPVATLGINLTQTYFSEEGERYGYLPSIFFAFLVATVIVGIFWRRNNSPINKSIFIFVIVLIVTLLGGQLLLKNFRAHAASVVAKSALFEAVESMRDNNYIGVLFFGLPDNFHGFPIFRNGWQLAIDFYLKDKPIILAPFNRSVYDPLGKFAVLKSGYRNYYYYNPKNIKLILAKPNFVSADYSTELSNYVYEPLGINDRYFGSALDISLTDNLAGNIRVALFFWNGSGWTINLAR